MGDSQWKGRNLTERGGLVVPLCSRNAYAEPNRSLQYRWWYLDARNSEINPGRPLGM